MRLLGGVPIKYDCCPHKKRRSDMTDMTEGQPREDTARKQPSTGQGEKFQKKPNLPTP